MTAETCHEHSGCTKDIENLKCDNKKQWSKLGELDERMDNIMKTLNTILGGIVVSIILILIEILIRIPALLKI